MLIYQRVDAPVGFHPELTGKGKSFCWFWTDVGHSWVMAVSKKSGFCTSVVVSSLMFIVSICFHPCSGRNDNPNMTGLRAPWGCYGQTQVAEIPSGQAFLQRSERLAAWGLGPCTAMSRVESGHMRLGNFKIPSIGDEHLLTSLLYIIIIINFPIKKNAPRNKEFLQVFNTRREALL